MAYHIPTLKVSFVHVICHSPCLTMKRKLYSTHNGIVRTNFYNTLKIPRIKKPSWKTIELHSSSIDICKADQTISILVLHHAW